MNEKILFCVTTANQFDFTERCLETAATALADSAAEILVVDDASTDGTPHRVRNIANVITKDEARGITDSWNLAYRYFREHDHDVLVLANNDILVPRGSMQPLARLLRHCDVVGPMTTLRGAHHQPRQDVESITPLPVSAHDPANFQLVQDFLVANPPSASMLELRYVSGFFFAMGRSIIQYELSDSMLFDARLRNIGNEDELCDRVRARGGKVACCPASFVFHYKGVSFEHHKVGRKVVLSRELTWSEATAVGPFTRGARRVQFSFRLLGRRLDAIAVRPVTKLGRRGRRLAGRIRRRLVGVRAPSLRVEHPICHDLASWAASWPGAERWVIDPPFTTTRPLPKTVEPEVHPSFAPLCSVPVPERALMKIPNGRIRGHVGLVVLPNDEFAGELIAVTPVGRQAMLRAEPAYYEPLPRALRKEGSFYPVLGLGVHHYYHWSHDIVMRMRGIADILPPDTQLIVPADMKPFERETLDLLGLDEHPRVPFPNGACWELENLYVVAPRPKDRIDSSEPYRWFRNAAMDRYGVREVKPDRRLYLTRRHDGHWRTTNEPEVESFLAGHGFETVAPGKLTFRAQIELFGQAEMIVGTGAGLFNMVFSPPGTKVLQVQEGSHIVHALWTAATAMGFEYYYLLGDTVPNPGGANADIHLPIAKLEASLQAMSARQVAESGCRVH